MTNELSVIIAYLPMKEVRQNMENTQYLSPLEQRNLDDATMDLESFMMDFFKEKPQHQVTWDDIELTDVDDDIQPPKEKVKKTKRSTQPKAIKSTSVTLKTPTVEVHSLLDALQERLVDNAKDAELYYLINVASFEKVMTTQAVIDWLDLRFTVDPTVCKFYDEPNARSRIKEFITKRTGVRHYIASDDKHITQDGTSFTIRLHDIANKKDLRTITDLLIGQYGAKREVMTIEAIELSFDFYGGDSSAIVIRLHKAMKYPVDARLFRIYKTKWTQQEIPTSPYKFYDHIKNGYNIGMGDHRSDEFCVRVYFKRTDKGGQPLPIEKHRARIEVTLEKSVFTNDDIDLHLDNLSEIIGHGFKRMQFTKLSKRAKPMEKDTYFTQVKPFGQEREAMLSISRHGRNLPDSIGVYTWLNEAKSSAVKNLKRKF